MKCQKLFSENNKRNIINLSSAELAQKMIKVKDKAIVINHAHNLALPCKEMGGWGRGVTLKPKKYAPTNLCPL